MQQCPTEHYDRARGNLDRHGVHFLTAYVGGGLRNSELSVRSDSGRRRSESRSG